jgi:hypothetical protein
MATHQAATPWLRTLTRLRSLQKLNTPAERGLAVLLLGGFSLSTALAFGTGSWQLWVLSAASFLAVMLGAIVETDAVVQRADLARAHEAMVKTNTAKPTGAPRVAEVPCVHGHAHRFVYGPEGWTLAEAYQLPAPPEETAAP